MLAKGGGGLGPAETVLRLRGHGHVLDPSREPKFVTLDATVALDIADRLFPTLAKVSAGARTALEARNDALHMGIAVTDQVDAAVAGMAKYAAFVLPLLAVSAEDFWGDKDDVAAAGRAVDARATRVADVTAAKTQLAEARYARFLIRYGDEAPRRARALEVRHRDQMDTRPGYTETCPACGHQGWVDLDADFDVDRDGDGGWVYFQTGEWVEGFSCPVCELRLDSEECEEADIRLTRHEDDEYTRED